MEEETFSTSLSSLSTLSSQTNYQTLVSSSSNRENNNSSYQTSQQQQPSLSNSPVNPDSCPFAIFLFRSNSSLELFEERKISLDKPCKIGRSVAKVRPEPNNAIFDCKVLSRNHALLWEENGKYYLQDTKSSNGTFLNGNRLGKSNEDSSPFELNSGDIIQFGVDVTENTKKVTHGCITVEVKLYHRPGVEAINRSVQQTNKIDIQTQELYQLALFLQEAIMREELLHQKLNSLQSYIDQAKESSENGWLTLIDEDRLLSRIDYLEKQLLVNAKSINDENLVMKINVVKDEKSSVENSAKATIQKLIEEKTDLSKKYDELKSMLSSRDLECDQLQKLHDDSKKSLIDLAEKYQELLNQIDELHKSLAESKTKYLEKVNQFDSDKQNYDSQLADLAQNEKNLTNQIELLIAEKDFQAKRLDAAIKKLEQQKHMLDLNNGFKENSNEIILKEIDEPILNDLSNLDETSIKPVHNGGIIGNNKINDNSNELMNESLSKNTKIISDANIFSKNNEEKENFNSNNDLNEFLDTNSQKSENKLSISSGSSSGLSAKNFDSISKMNDMVKLNEEIETLKGQLESEVKKNLKLREDIKEINKETVESEKLKSIENKLNEKSNKLKLLELDLEEKNLLINKLLTENNYESTKSLSIFQSKNNQKEINTSDIIEQESSIAATRSFELNQQEYGQIKTLIQSINNSISKFVEKNQQTSLDERSSSYLEESNKSLNELNDWLKRKESRRLDMNLTDAQKEADQNRLEYLQLEMKFNEIKETCQEQDKKLSISDNLLEEIAVSYDNISLRAKIVSYFSMVPLFILIIAIMIAFYPTLATITATGL